MGRFYGGSGASTAIVRTARESAARGYRSAVVRLIDTMHLGRDRVIGAHLVRTA